MPKKILASKYLKMLEREKEGDQEEEEEQEEDQKSEDESDEDDEACWGQKVMVCTISPCSINLLDDFWPSKFQLSLSWLKADIRMGLNTDYDFVP